MIRNLLILFTGAIMLFCISWAWAKTAPDLPQEKKPQAQQEEQAKEKPAVRNPFKKPGQDDAKKKLTPAEEKIILNKLPQLSLQGILKMKGKEPVGLLVVDALKGAELFRVRKGDKISITLAGEDVLRSSDLEPEPEPVTPQNGKNGKNGKKPVRKTNTNQDKTGKTEDGAAPAPKKPKIKLKEIQVELEIMEVNRDGLAVRALPLNERILVR